MHVSPRSHLCELTAHISNRGDDFVRQVLPRVSINDFKLTASARGTLMTETLNNYLAYQRTIAEDREKQKLIEHLRNRQLELWTKCGSILAFDGLLIASLLVLLSTERKDLVPNDIFEIGGCLSCLALLLVSALFSLSAINQRGKYPAGKSAEEYLNIFLKTMDRTTLRYKTALVLCTIASILFIYVLFSCLITSDIFKEQIAKLPAAL
jgi:hypothetical protein